MSYMFRKLAVVELMLSSNCHVTLRLTVFEISTVKWPKFRPKISDLGGPGGHRPKRRKDLSGTDMYHRAFHPPVLHLSSCAASSASVSSDLKALYKSVIIKRLTLL